MLARANCGLKLQPMLRQGRARSVISDLYIPGSLTLMFFKCYEADPDIFPTCAPSKSQWARLS